MLRKRKNRRYNETNDEEGDGERKFDLQQQIKSERFEQIKDKHLVELSGDQFTLRRIQKEGFEKPILITKPDGLDLRVPPKSFLVRDVRNCVGQQRIIDVMDVKTQKNIEMSMKDWCKYYESKNRDRLLNVISLEFSHTKLDELVDSPMIVKLLDWVDLVWPKFLKESQTESTNTIDKMKYPKVQKYCLMSVKGSYTDFHIDFGGTSVWYHILRGKKIFWMVPPTELNLQIFEEWTLSGMQQDVFFGDTVEECFRVELCAGNTFFIPSGWIHAVYTLEDSLVFGGNFLHSFGIENQLKVAKIEDATKVPIKFRYPFYTEILWYVVQHYVYCLTDKDHLHRPDLTALVKQAETELSNNKTNNSIEIEDETTESDLDESDKKSKKKKAPAPKQKRAKTIKTAQLPKKAVGNGNKRKRPSPPSDYNDGDEEEDKEGENDDESTDIDSGSEELASYKQANKPATNTCRMTKNSLLRLQYEVEGQQQQRHAQTSSKLQASKQESKGDSGAKSSPKKKAETTSNQTSAQKQAPASSASSTAATGTINLTEMVLSHESKLNGWSCGTIGSSGSQSIWSNPASVDSKGPKRVHLTKYELTGLKVLVKYLSKLSGVKKNLPNLIRNSRALLDDCRKLIADHENDDPVLAITGKPITPELLREPKKTDINELIGQFFKSTETSGVDESTSSHNSSASGNHLKAMKSEPLSSASLTSQQRMKSNHTSEDKTKSSNSSSSSALAHENSPSKSASAASSSFVTPYNKETKCLSTNKKLSTATAASSSATASPPPRPKSPPTRPLSNNQYTSATKNDNNLLLPGSFADLIAATSTGKVFDVSGADVASSLFGIGKDLGSSSPAKSPQKKGTSGGGSQKTTTAIANTGATTITNKLPYDISPSATTSTGAGAGSSTKEQPKPTSSPEPPKMNAQKRFISPTFNRPQTKEKLIYASAPYISPVHATDQARSGNPYPWQTPTHQPQLHAQQQALPATYSPTTPRPHQPAHSLTQHSAATVSGTTVSSSGQVPYAPQQSDLRALNQGHLMPAQPSKQRHEQQSQPPAQHEQAGKHQLSQSGDSKLLKSDSDDYRQRQQQSAGNREHSKATSVIVKPNQQQQEQQQKRAAASHSDSSEPPSKSTTSDINGNKTTALAATTIASSVAKTSSSDVKTPAAAVGITTVTTVTSNTTTTTPVTTTSCTSPGASKAIDEKAKRPTKPRGPPKKSKEARQVLEIESIAAPPVSVPVIKVGSPSINLASHTAVASIQVPAQKVKAKRQKQRKQESTEQALSNQQQNQHQQIIRPQVIGQQPSVICGLVAPPATSIATSGGKLNQQYIISRPLLFNTMPAFSAAQLQQMPRTSMPLISTPMGLPLQQGARIVWATQPRRLAVPVSGSAISPIALTSTTVTRTSTPANAKIAITTPRPPTIVSTASSTHADNAALLSLATTALSTAPMVSSPALSHIGQRAPNPQAIMMNTTINQQTPAVFANHSFFRPYLQQVPMTQFVAAPRAGAAGAPTGMARPTGQLVFARLPNQVQPRYLIAQPGFVQQRFQTPHIVTSQPTSTLAFAAFKPPATSTVKVMKTKKVKTS